MTENLVTRQDIDEIKATLRALLLLQLRGIDSELDGGSVEGMLFRAGFKNQVDIIELTGTARSTVSRRLKEEGLT